MTGVRFSRFANRLFVRLALLFALLTGLAVVLVATDFIAVAVILAVAALAQAWLVIRFVNRTNAELARFLDAIRYDDFSQSFLSVGHLGSSFEDLKVAFEEVMERFRDARGARETQRRYLEVLVEHVPVALVSVHDDGRVMLLNNAARRLLDAPAETTLEALATYGSALVRDLTEIRAGERRVTRAVIDHAPRQLVMSATQITIDADVERLISLQDIQRELDDTELAAWHDMVRVLSHEIGNSITPIASLARTADELVVELRDKVGDDALSDDIHDAIVTITRRSEGLLRFIKSYRELARLPPPRKQSIRLKDYFERLERLVAADWRDQGITLHVKPPPEGLTIAADESLLDQVMINVVRNAAEAARASAEPQVWLEARLSERGRPLIEIADNGRGIDEELGDKIFLPFFTTKSEGSGIGLSLARQVMLMHKGSISARPRPGGGARFQLVF